MRSSTAFKGISINNYSFQFRRWMSGVHAVGTGKKVRIEVDVDATAEQYLIEGALKPKHHPGVHHLKRQSLPEKFVYAAKRLLSNENVKRIVSECGTLKNQLWSRHLPIERQEFREKVSDIEAEFDPKESILRPFMSVEQLRSLDQAREKKIRRKTNAFVNHWKQIQYDKSKALVYLLTRSAGEYAALLQIFTEIHKRDPSFTPNTLCDFGSGLGTSVWASRSLWQNHIKEVLCVDISRDMNEIAELLIRGGNLNNDHGLMGLFYRQFLAESNKVSYDLVVSAYSLFELPSLKDRLRTIDILWKKTNKYLVIVEQGTNAGFRAIIEARDYILQLDKEGPTVADCHVFSPCPNSASCPRFTKDDIPCNFYVKYQTLYPFHEDQTHTEMFSYIVLKKGKKDENDEQWPRLVRDPLLRHNHIICRVCTKQGKLAEIVVTKKKHSRILYRMVRKSQCGDLLPVTELTESDFTELSTPETTE